MNKIFIIFIILSFFLTSCSYENRSNNIKLDSDKNNSIKEELISIDSFNKLTYEIDNNFSDIDIKCFSNFDFFPKEWILLSYNESGFFIHMKNEIYLNSKKISDTSICSFGQMENICFDYNRIEYLDSNLILFTNSDYSEDQSNDLYFELLDTMTFMSIFSWEVYNVVEEDDGISLIENGNGLFIPKEKAYLFPHIDEINLTSPTNLFPIEILDIDSIRTYYFNV